MIRGKSIMVRSLSLVAALALLAFASGGAQAQNTGLAETLQQHVTKNWIASDVPGNPELIHVDVVLQMRRDGTVDGEPEVSVTDDGGQSDATVRAYVQSVRAAIASSQPFPLPADRYDVWRTIVISFNLKEESGK